MNLSGNEANCAGSEAEQINAEAIAWVERADREDWGAEDKAALEQWLAQSTAQTVAFLRARDGWQRADRLAALRGTFGPPRSPDTRRNSSFHLRVAAGAIAAASIFGLWLALPMQRAQSEFYSTKIGGYKLLTLADGSQIELNTNSAIRTRLDEHHRTVWIERGEVYFQVAHNAARPFVVLTNDHRITDLGTKFVVRQTPGEVQVTLVEGRAEFDTPSQPNGQHAILTSGDVAVATADAMSVLKRSRHSVDNDLAWRRGVLIFNRTTLSDAAIQLNRYNEQKVIVADADAAQERIEGTFPANNVELFGRVARSVLGLHVRKQGKDLVISR